MLITIDLLTNILYSCKRNKLIENYKNNSLFFFKYRNRIDQLNNSSYNYYLILKLALWVIN